MKFKRINESYTLVKNNNGEDIRSYTNPTEQDAEELLDSIKPSSKNYFDAKITEVIIDGKNVNILKWSSGQLGIGISGDKSSYYYSYNKNDIIHLICNISNLDKDRDFEYSDDIIDCFTILIDDFDVDLDRVEEYGDGEWSNRYERNWTEQVTVNDFEYEIDSDLWNGIIADFLKIKEYDLTQKDIDSVNNRLKEFSKFVYDEYRESAEEAAVEYAEKNL